MNQNYFLKNAEQYGLKNVMMNLGIGMTLLIKKNNFIDDLKLWSGDALVMNMDEKF